MPKRPNCNAQLEKHACAPMESNCSRSGPPSESNDHPRSVPRKSKTAGANEATPECTALGSSERWT